MKANIFIPKKIKVGFQERDSTYTKKLAYVIYYDLQNKLRKETSWQSLESKKNYISYDCVNNKLSIYDRQILKEFGQIYFKNKEACEKAIEIFKDELLWYFTEFEEQLY